MSLFSTYILSYRNRLLLYFSTVLFLFSLVVILFQWQYEVNERRAAQEKRLRYYAQALRATAVDFEEHDTIVAKMRLFLPQYLAFSLHSKEGKMLYNEGQHMHAVAKAWQAQQKSHRTTASSPMVVSLDLPHEERLHFLCLQVPLEQKYLILSLPYDDSLQSLFRTNNLLLWAMSVCVPLLFLSLFFVVLRFSRGVDSLRHFVDSAKRGLVDYSHLSFPPTELGVLVQEVVQAFQRAEENQRLALRNKALVEQEREQKQLFKQRMSSNIAHELRTPVAAIQGYLEILSTHKHLPEQQRIAFLERAYGQSQRLSDVIRDVALISQMEAAAQELSCEKLSLALLFDELCRDLSPALQVARVRVANVLPPSLCIVGNRSLLYAIFRNLLENTIKYAAPCQCTLALTSETPTHYALCFANDGPCIPEKHLAQIFERFYRTDEGRTRGVGGSGLGLAIVRNAVIFHKGEVSVSNQAQRGVAFRFTLAKEAKSDL